MTRIAAVAPAYCASCFAAYGPERRYVDFEAAYDGPTIPGSPANQPIDDLIICENCLEEAFRVLDPEGQAEEIKHLKRELAEAHQEIIQKDKAISGYNMTNRELVGMSVERHAGRPAVMGVDDETKKEINDRLRQNKKVKA